MTLPPNTVVKARRATRPTRERLIGAAVELFQTMGYHGASITEVLSRARTPKGSLYHHFPGGKEQLAIESLAWLQTEVSAYLDELQGRGADASMLVEAIARFTAAGIRSRRTPRGSLMAVLIQDASDSPAIVAAVRRYAGSMRRRLAKACGDGEQGAAFADQAMAVIQGAGVMARVEGRAERAVEIVESWLRSWKGAGPQEDDGPLGS